MCYTEGQVNMHLGFTICTVVSTIGIMTSVFSKALLMPSQRDVVETAVLFMVYNMVKTTDGEQAGGTG